MRTSSVSVKPQQSPLLFTLITLLLVLLAAKLLHINALVILVTLPILLIMVMIISPLLLPFVIFCYGVYIATRISHTVFMEKQHATYDLLHLPPVPTIRADWTLATGVLYRGHFFELLNHAVHLTVFGAGIMLLITMGVFLASGYSIIWTEFIVIVAIITLFYTGYIQSIVLSIIVGLLVPQNAANVEQNSFNAAFAYIIVQFGTYLLAVFLGFGLLPLLHSKLNITNPWIDVSLILWQFVITYGIREVLISYLWRYLVYQLNTDAMLPE